MAEVKTATGKGKISKIEELLDLGGDIDIAVAYIDMHGLKLVEDRVKTDQSNIRNVRLLVDLKSCSTNPNAVRRMVKLSEECPDRFKCKEYYVNGHPHEILHSKLLISADGNSVTFLTGSCNLTQNGLVRNREHGLLVQCGNDKGLADRTRAFFGDLWHDETYAKTVDVKRASEYEIIYRKNRRLDRRKGDLPPPGTRYWLIMCDPDSEENEHYDYAQFKIDKVTEWGNRGGNRPTRSFLKSMRVGDGVFFYETGNKRQQIMCTAQVVREARPDSSCMEDGIRPTVEIELKCRFSHKVTRDEIKLKPSLRTMELLVAPQLTVQRVTIDEWNEILRMGMGDQEQ